MAGPELTRGKWFARHGYWVFPYLDRFLSGALRNLDELKKKQREFAKQYPQNSSVKKNSKRAKKKGEPAQQHPPTPSDWVRRFEVLDRQARSAVQWLAEDGSLPYNAQPKWSLRELRPGSPDEACAIIKEFLGLAKLASEAFDWEHPLVLPKMKWMEHSWKHVSMSDLEKIESDVGSGTYPFPDFSPPIDLFESGDEARDLFQRAAQREPTAVARLHYLLPMKWTHFEVAEYFFAGAETPEKVRDMVSKIPSPDELATEYRGRAVMNPDSEEADEARRAFRHLISNRAVTGSTGRPKIVFGEETLTLIYRMSYALFKQVKEVARLLSHTVQIGTSLEKEEKRDSLLRGFYPWLTRHFSKPHELAVFLKSQSTAGACRLTGIVLQISPSKVSKTVFG